MSAITNDPIIQPFARFLKEKDFSPEASRCYVYIVHKYLCENPKAKFAKHKDILSYLAKMTKNNYNNKTKQRRLSGIKKYYDFLFESGVRETHPCRSLGIVGIKKRGIIHSDLLSQKEMISLLKRNEYFPRFKLRNQVALSLMLFQAMMPGEIVNLKLKNIDLKKGFVYADNGRVLSARWIPLNKHQISLIKKYISKERDRLLIKGKNEFLLVSGIGGPWVIGSFNYYMKELRKVHTKKYITSKLIRDSVISYWLNTKKIPLEQVQLLAGHKWACSTQRYFQISSEKERKEINKWFPI